MSHWENCTCDPYTELLATYEKRWKKRFPTGCPAEEDDRFRPLPVADQEGAKRLAKRYYIASQMFASLPTVLLAGLYLAAICAFFSFAPAWIGFIIGVVITAIGAAWAFAG